MSKETMRDERESDINSQDDFESDDHIICEHIKTTPLMVSIKITLLTDQLHHDGANIYLLAFNLLTLHTIVFFIIFNFFSDCNFNFRGCVKVFTIIY